MIKRIKEQNDLDLHAKGRDIKLRKKNRPTDNRKSVQLIAKLAISPRKK
ncbi:hypothetical protein KKE14_01485 [Patescibacteria group bacterium]|nr:hypothetical protein [Patescibacteria group bacterium]